MAIKKSKKRIDQQIPQDRPPAFRPDQAGGSIGGLGKKLTPTKKWKLKTKERGFFDKKVKVIDEQKPIETPEPTKKVTPAKSKSSGDFFDDLSLQDTSKVTKGYRGQQQKRTVKLRSKSTKPIVIPKNISAKEKLRIQKINREIEAAKGVTTKTQVAQKLNPKDTKKFNELAGDITLTEQQARTLSVYKNPTGIAFDNKAVVVGSKVLTTAVGGKVLIELAVPLLPKKEQDNIELLPIDEEVKIQKVIEEKQTLSPEEISDLAQKTQPKTITTPLEEEERQRVRQSPLPDEQEAQILTKEKKEDVNPFEEPFEEQLEDVGLADDLEDDTDIVEEPEETERVIIPEPDVDRPEVEQIEIGGEVDLEEEIATSTEDETQFEPLSEEEIDTDVEVATDTATEQEAITPADFSSDFEPEQTTKKKPKKKIAAAAFIPKKKKPKTPPFKLPKEEEKEFFSKSGKRPNIVNFKTRKGFFQANFKKGTVKAAPKGITLDTNQGFREDSMKVITRTEAATKFKTRRDPLKALERKGII
jgi:hypothetical protein